MLLRKNIAEFEKVDFKEFVIYVNNLLLEFRNMTMQQLIYCYNSINIPYRMSDRESAYNFESPFNFKLNSMESIIIPTGISCNIKLGWILSIVKTNPLIEVESVDILDTSTNGDQILIKMTNISDEIFTCNRNDIICKGIFIPYGIVKNDNVKNNKNNYEERYYR